MTAQLLSCAREVWESYCLHPFVRGIADGSLDREKFRFYMIQDYLYLIDYAKVFALGVVKARDMDALCLFASYVHQILSGEMEIHRRYMQRLGISLEEAEQAPAAPDNLSYTSYMLRIAYEYGPGEIAAAILSCALSYEYIARRITAEHPRAGEHPFYGEWIRGYANEDYSASNQALADLTDRLTANYTEAQQRRLEEIFLTCSRYESSFWDMAWEMRR